MTDLDGAADEFRDLAKNLALVGAGELRRELYDAIGDAAQPLEGNIRRGLPAYLPDRYAAVLDGDLRISTTKRTGTDPGVRIVATGRGRGGVQRRRLHRLNAGVLAHPLYGNRRHWFNQEVRPLFFDEPVEAGAPRVREKILAAMRRIEDKALGR